MTEIIAETLEQIGNLMILMRDIPAAFIDGYMSASRQSHFYIKPEHDWDGETGGGQTAFYQYTSSGRTVVRPENYPLIAVVLKSNENRSPDRKKEPMFSLYFYTRRKIGCVGEFLIKADCDSIGGDGCSRMGIEEIYDWGVQRGSPLITLGVNEHYKPEQEETDLDAIIVGEEMSKMLLAPHLPIEDANEILTRLKGLVMSYKGISEHRLDKIGIDWKERSDFHREEFNSKIGKR